MPADPRRAKDLFAAAIDLPPADRAAFLDRECGDAELRGRVAALLEAHDAPASALDRPLAQSVTDAHVPTETPGMIVAGRYKLLESIGEGGMGEVWVADQLEPIKRRVALKLIKPGMDSRSVLARFEAERQALALMDHPNIAKVLDAGTTEDGRPYFVMELVKGTPITTFCDARKLTPKERLELFVPVCQAIQHAHHKGIIHRDIKPTNVLVALHDEKPVPKVIDFGVAKAIGQQLTEKTLYTGFGALVGTPAYMAPEQATFNQLDVDTRADVYALGVLLYELLAGSPPVEPERLKRVALDEVLRLVREEEPPRPSARLSTSEAKATIAATRQTDAVKLSALMRGELDWIVMKALEKDRTRRYETANGLAKDVERYLSGDAVEACPPTLGYRLRKAYRRNRAAILGGGAFAAVLMVATGVSLAFGVMAKRAEAEAERQRQDAVASADRADTNSRTAAVNEEFARQETAKLRAEQDMTRRMHYAGLTLQAQVAFGEHRIERMVQLLDATKPKPGGPDLRGWEWHYLDRLISGPVVRTLDFTPKPGEHAIAGSFSADGRWRVHPRATAEGLAFEVWDTRSGAMTSRIPKSGLLPLPASQPKPLGRIPPVEIYYSLNPTLSDDGKFLAAAWRATVPDKQDETRVRLWEVDTAKEIPGPTDPVRATWSELRIGRGAEWLAWYSVSAERRSEGNYFRWDRSSGTVTKLHGRNSFAVPGELQFTADGKSAIHFTWLPTQAEAAIHISDLSVTPVTVRREPINVLSTRSRGTLGVCVISPGATAAAFWLDEVISVYQLPEVKLLWKAPYPRSADVFGGVNRPFDVAGVSDDGRRVLLELPGQLRVLEVADLEKPGTPRHLVFPHRYSPNNRYTLSADGMSCVFSHQNVVRVFDLSRAPDAIVPKRVGTRSVEMVTGASSPRSSVVVSDIVVRDETGREIFRATERTAIPGKGAGSPLGGFSFHLDADDRRLIVTGGPQGGNPARATNWELYALDAPTGVIKLAEGTGFAMSYYDGKHFWAKEGPAADAPVAFYDIETAKRLHALPRIPDGHRGGSVIVPGNRYATITYPSATARDRDTSGDPPAPLTLRLYDMKTGRELWHKELGLSEPRANRLECSPDGQQLIVTHGVAASGVRVWVGRTADGAEERTLELSTSFPAGRLTPYRRLGTYPNGRLVVAVENEIQIWDTRSGARTSRIFTGKLDLTAKAVLSADGTRLFLQDGTISLRVWDVVAGLELLTLKLPEETRVNSTAPFRLDGERLLLPTVKGVRVYYGTPVEK